MTTECEHTFKTTMPVERFHAIISQSCRDGIRIEVEAHDRGCVPEYRILNVIFANPEDRDRARIALRFLEKDRQEKKQDDMKAAIKKPVLTEV